MASPSKFAMRALFGVNFYSLTEQSSACFDFEVTQMGDNGPRRCGLGYHNHSNCLLGHAAQCSLDQMENSTSCWNGFSVGSVSDEATSSSSILDFDRSQSHPGAQM